MHISFMVESSNWLFIYVILKQAIMQKHSIKEALAYEEDFFRKNAV